MQLPGIQDTQRAKDLIGRTALLEFKLVDEAHDVNAAVQGAVPPGSEVLYKVDEDRATQRTSSNPLPACKRARMLTGASLTDARVALDSQYGEPYVSIEFDRKGARTFERVTGENVGKRLAIVLDNKVYSAPTIQEKIAGGKARITGRFTMEEARDLAIVLRAGALPAPVTVLEERTVGPSLGADSIRAGLISILVGGPARARVHGGVLPIFRDAGQLRGAARPRADRCGAGGLRRDPDAARHRRASSSRSAWRVDNNVLIYERIREELRLGKTPRGAVDAGFDRATTTIMDANITTLISSVVLFQFGTGPIKGFAVTLSIGVIASMFTAIVVSRVVFDYFLDVRKINRLSI